MIFTYSTRINPIEYLTGSIVAGSGGWHMLIYAESPTEVLYIPTITMYTKAVAAITLAVAGAVSAADFKVNTPMNVAQCQPAQLSWSGGQSPYYPSLSQPGDTSKKLDADGADFSQTDATSLTWKQVTLKEGTQFLVVVRDSTGAVQNSAPVTVSAGSTSCMSGSSSGGAAAAAGSSGSSSSGGNSSSSSAASSSSSSSGGSSSSSSHSSSSSAAKSSSGGSSSTGGAAAAGGSSESSSPSSSSSSGSSEQSGASSAAGLRGLPAVAAGIVGVVVAALI
ncbi:hypothetical protein MCUN1_000638 [Malassezia cuniculi]|uniref:Ser-Thr-rich glycosyl-phosphatidyl-inositol-anchored membrane family-domain-containing protein n=1 Tax=Malassezia cuniculi TaxID=948313 RepID=A0AAF0EW87_9BASI|nr:hypothetical protein MCUN1_000638 [Malassezia cuniculi]